ncbi:uncharacterized protein LOC127701639 [Mytilus californianus]|uniref:uncharacterized protein LOC127701639 n=1 Tax=Mytilus californianus TaxID=6549 RepID=UPI002246DA13|nr:uncharacterized protein LOC127701639 [Mytilus californianus]
MASLVEIETTKSSAKPCELCEQESILQFKCVECEKVICDSCKGIHAKVPVLSNHFIINIDTRLVPQHIQKIQLCSMSCDNHAKKFHCLFCRTCNKLVCPDCVSSIHTKHEFETLEKACENKLGELLSFDSFMEEKVHKLRKLNENLKKEKETWECEIDKVKRYIDENEREIKEAVTKYAEELREDVIQKRKTRNQEFDGREQKNCEQEALFTDFRGKIKKALDSDQGYDIFNTVSEKDKLNTLIDNTKMTTEIVDLPKSKLSPKRMAVIFGQINHFSVPAYVAVKHDSSYTINVQGIDKMGMCIDGSYWASVYNNDKDNSYLIKTTLSRVINWCTTVEVNVFDMAITTDDTVIASVHMTPEVKRIRKNGKLEEFINVSPLIARGIHVNKENEIILGVRDSGDPFQITEESCRKILVFGMDGNQKESYEFDKKNKRLVTIPRRICTDVNGDIIVIDSMTKETNRVLSIARRAGEIKWTYGGEFDFKQQKAFDPNDITSTQTGYIVLSEVISHRIYILSLGGDFLTFCDLRTMGVVLPRALAIDSKGLLWVGCANDRINQDFAKKHKLPNLTCLRLEISDV